MEEFEAYDLAARAAEGEIISGMVEAGESLDEGNLWSCVGSDPRTFYSTKDKMFDLGTDDFGDVDDIARGTIVVTEEDDVYNVFDALKEEFGSPVEYQDSFEMPHPSGYRDLTAVFESKTGEVDGEPINFTITI